jgi:hypothetical protein
MRMAGSSDRGGAISVAAKIYCQMLSQRLREPTGTGLKWPPLLSGDGEALRMSRSGRSVSWRYCKAFDVSDEVDNLLVALGCVVGRALLYDSADLISIGL